MKKFIWGLVIGLVIGVLGGINIGKGKDLLSNPFADKAITEQLKDTASEAGEKIKEGSADVIEKSREAIHEATKPEQEKE
jgi:hypothetical protein